MTDTSEYSIHINRLTDVELVDETIQKARTLELSDYWESPDVETLYEQLEVCKRALLKRMNPEVLIR